MKNKFLASLMIVFLVFGLVGVAGATYITDTYDIGPIFMENGSSINFSHTITDDGFTPGVIGNPGVDTITSASLIITTYDNEDNPAESYKLILDVNFFASPAIQLTSKSTSSNPSTYLYTFGGFTSLQPDGKLDVTISRQAGDFYFAKSELNVEWTEFVQNPGGGTTAPEPATMLLLGFGLLGLAGVSRKMN